VREHAEDPVERRGELVPASAGVEEAQDVERDDGVGAGALGVKVGLAEGCSVSGLRRPCGGWQMNFTMVIPSSVMYWSISSRTECTT
jgi:hypothetical protein